MVVVAYQGGDMTYVRNFFEQLQTITFKFVIKSQGWGAGIDSNRAVCLLVSRHDALSHHHDATSLSPCYTHDHLPSISVLFYSGIWISSMI